MRTRAEKQKIVDGLVKQFTRQKFAIFSDFHGISVEKMRILRRILKKNDAEYKVTKKTLFDRALETVGLPLKTKDLKGEIGVVLSYTEELTPLKDLVKFVKEHESFKLLGGIFSGSVLDAKEILTLAKLPPKEILISQFLGVLQSPFRGLVTVLGGNIRNLVIVLNKIKEKK